jgi:putative membrane protein
MTRLMLGALAGAFSVVLPILGAQAAALDDKTFIADAVGTNLEEIQIGQLAQQKSQNADVKAYGQMPVTDHTAANSQATAIATKIGAAAPTALPPDAQQAYNALAALSGPAFDQMFLTDMVTGHQMAIQMFTAQTVSSNADVASFAKASLPTLQMHLANAQKLQASAGKPG